MGRLPRSLGDIAAACARPGPRPARGVGVSVHPAARSAPLRVGDALLRQHDPTTCGSTALLALAALGDPVLARWLEDGTLPDRTIAGLPPEIPPRALTAARAAERIRAAQHHIKRRTDARALGPFPWPPWWGTPPWTAAREARFPGVRFVHRPVDDRGEAGRAMLGSVMGALRRGFPVLLFTGGDLGTGITTAVPRHVVLALPESARPWGLAPPERGLLRIFEPSFGRVHEIEPAGLVDRTAPSLALGGWAHVQWLVLPSPTPHALPS